MSKGTNFRKRILPLILLIICNTVKKIVLFGLILISFVGYSQEERKVENKDDKERPIETSSVENEKNKIYATAKIAPEYPGDRKSTRLNSSHVKISYA